MLGKTHIAFALLVAIVAVDSFEVNSLLFVFVVVLSALLPDLDVKNSTISRWFPFFSWFSRHRGMLHSFVVAVMGYFLMSLFSEAYGIAFFLGYCSHLILDMLTPQGIVLLAPFSQKRFHGFLKTGSFEERMLFLLICVLIVIALVY
ncbi:MAG: metal-dependent hydrolase [Nanoarchaeota archaeon]|nr:metal-dependent hydrolase [Nanoarchaeota archaeon]